MSKRRLLCFVLLILLLTALPNASLALDDDEFGGYSANSLTIQVGYPGGPYFDKTVFTLSDLESMDIVYADYTFIDNMPSVIIAHVKGVRISDIIDAAGVDIGAVRTFHFWISDKAESSYTSFSKSELIDTPRYCYYSLPDNFDYDLGEGNEYATSDGVRVDAVLALADDWTRAIAGATFGSDYMNLNTNTRFRLVFGQTDAVTRTASRSAKWVYAVVAELRGEPSIALGVSELDILAGSTLSVEALVDAADPVIVENVPVTWTSDNEGVASVDESGNISAHSEGTAVITAQFLSATASVTVTVSVPDEEAPPVSGTTGQGDGAGQSTQPSEATIDELPIETQTAPPSPEEPEVTPEITSPTVTPEITPPSVTPPEIEESPEIEPIEERSILPIIGVVAMILFFIGGVVTLFMTRRKRVPQT